MRSGVIVAGGYSTRFGQEEKALAAVDGEPMLVRVVETLSKTTDEVVINCRKEQRGPFERALGSLDVEPRFAVDPVPDRGPVAGLRTGLRFARGTQAVVVSCDVPHVEASLFAYLLERRRADGVDAVVPRVGGRLQPLCGVYETAVTKDACTLTIERDEKRLSTLLSRLDVRTIEESVVEEYTDPITVESLDTPSELRNVAGSRSRS